jgi:hypothetical protein
MSERDLLVGVVAISLGAMMIYSAVINEGWCFQMALARKLEKHKGQSSARILIGGIGAFVTLLGAYILLTPYHTALLSSQDSKPPESKENRASLAQE